MTVSEDIKDVVNKVTGTLPPSFVALLFLNMLFILGLIWFVHDATVARIEAVKEIFKTCAVAIAKGSGS